MSLTVESLWKKQHNNYLFAITFIPLATDFSIAVIILQTSASSLHNWNTYSQFYCFLFFSFSTVEIFYTVIPLSTAQDARFEPLLGEVTEYCVRELSDIWK